METAESLKIIPLRHHKRLLVAMEDVTLGYPPKNLPVCKHLSLEIKAGDRAVLDGRNGSGKSSVIKAILGTEDAPGILSGKMETASGLIISYVSQDTSWLFGSIDEFTGKMDWTTRCFWAILQKTRLSREHFLRKCSITARGRKRRFCLLKAFVNRPIFIYGMNR